jgi:DNA-directed RNA polymerase subunit M/transcription elongation factor TFIIS
MSAFCKGCNNILDISKTRINDSVTENTPTEVSESDDNINYSDVINKLLKDEIIEPDLLNKIDFMYLQQSDIYMKKSSAQKKKIKGKINKILNKDDSDTATSAFYVCNNCSYTEKIKDKELIISRSSDTNMNKDIYFKEKLKNYYFSDVLPYQRGYKCRNKNCATHTNTTGAVQFFREPDSTHLWYICQVCHETWKVS